MAKEKAALTEALRTLNPESDGPATMALDLMKALAERGYVIRFSPPEAEVIDFSKA